MYDAHIRCCGVGLLRRVTERVESNISNLRFFLQAPWITDGIKFSKFLKPSISFRFEMAWQLFVPSESFHPSFLHQYFSSRYEGRRKSKGVIHWGSFAQHVFPLLIPTKENKSLKTRKGFVTRTSPQDPLSVITRLLRDHLRTWNPALFPSPVTAVERSLPFQPYPLKASSHQWVVYHLPQNSRNFEWNVNWKANCFLPKQKFIRGFLKHFVVKTIGMRKRRFDLSTVIIKQSEDKSLHNC